MAPLVAVVCQATPAIGLGHVTRCAGLADELEAAGMEPALVVNRHPATARALGGRAAAAVVDGVDDFADAVAALQPAAVLADCNELDPQQMARLRRLAPVVVVSPQGPGRWYGDLALLHALPDPERRPGDAVAEVRAGPTWALVARRIRRVREAPPARGQGEVLRIVVSMGGADAAGLTAAAVRGLAEVGLPLEVRVVLGPAQVSDRALEESLGSLRHPCHVLTAPPDLPRLLAECHLAVLAMGTTAYEACCLGTPSVQVAPSVFHARVAASLAERGALVDTGVADGGTPGRVADAVRQLAGDRRRLRVLGERAAEVVDGRGMDRVVSEVSRLARRGPH